jgi:hypothetical protein
MSTTLELDLVERLFHQNRVALATVGLLVLITLVSSGCGRLLDTRVSAQRVFVNETDRDVVIWDQTDRKTIVRISPKSHWTGSVRLGTHDGNLTDQVYVIRVDSDPPVIYVVLGDTLFTYDTAKVSREFLKLETNDGKRWLTMTYSRETR